MTAPNRQHEHEARRVYDLWVDSYLKGDEVALMSTVGEDLTLIGTAESELFFKKSEVAAFMRATIDQVAGKVELRDRDIRVASIDSLVRIDEFSDMYVLTGATWSFYARTRLSTWLRQVHGQWEICHQHSSFPDHRTRDGETLAPDLVRQENLQLREAVKRRTVELEHKNRELEIEACLERVRTQAMAMRAPGDLPSVSEQLFKELRVLGFSELRNAMINIHDDERSSFINYDYSDTLGQSITPLSYTIHPLIEKQVKQIRSSKEAFSETIFTGQELEDMKLFRKGAGEQDDPRIEQATALYYYFYSIGDGSIGISTFQPVGDQKLGLLKRFRNVFDFAYQRYLDVVQAETRAKEALVEAALERVRAVAMSMKKPADMLEVCHTISDQLQLLGVANIRNVQTAILHDDKGTYLNYEYFTQYRTTSILEIVTRLHPKVEEFAQEIRRARDAYFTTSFSGEELRDWIEYRKKTNQNADPLLEQATSVHYYFYSIGPGALGLSTYAPLRDEELDVFKRFRNVFDLAYRRFLDIEQAEAHAKDAQIELSLERVRARTLAMHRSDELVEASDVFFEQLGSLGIGAIRTGVGTFDESGETIDVWSRSQTDGDSGRRILGAVPKKAHPFFEGCFDAWKRNEPYFVHEFSGEEVEAYYRSLTAYLSYPAQTLFNPREVFYTFFFAEGSLNVVRPERLTDEQLIILQRFAGVFGQMYRRFLDLQVAEAQAREATIEAALERVRSKAMAMRNSGDLSATSGLVFTELRKLGITSVRCGVVLLSKDFHQGSLYFTASSVDSDLLAHVGSIDLTGHPSLERQYDQWLKQEDYLVTLQNEELLAYYEQLHKQNPVPFIPSDQGEQEEHGYYLYFSEGQFYAWAKEPYTGEELAVLNRFKAILELTFRRYLELEKAEAQAREAQIEASLERVRSRTLAMQKSDELAETAAVLFRQLMALGIAPNRLYIAIIKDDTGNAEFWLTDEDGSRVSSGFAVDLKSNRTFQKMFAGWTERKSSLTIDMQGQELQEYFAQLGELNVPFKGGLSQKRRVQTIAYFSQGFLGMASPDLQPEETTQLLERFAAVFNLTFTRFNDLKLAEAQARQAHLDLIQLQNEKKRAEEALTELRETQVQLLQQEKLASLGQLTAGIAHEIKNPLNFVNNFSSVSLELLDEAIEEITATAPEGMTSETRQLLADVRTNLTKIIQHGTRADGIVKSMLQHSRGGSGRKEPTDLNALVREFTNLAFHGMRAAKHPINVDMVLDLQDPMKPVSVIAEDFSRVIINLCQNAFDAMRDKFNLGTSSGGSEAYLPKLTVRTRSAQGKVMVEVSDNGPGIPDTIRDKVLQPFFTTKKGTHGTGLGLSITHDIVKAHGGVMSIQSNPDGGATFVVELPSDAR